MAIMLAWQALTVRYSHGGNWTALFRTGELFSPPAELSAERIYRFPGPGYDGQFYHYIAHDPLITRKFAKSIDAPRLRYRRIFVPALAFVLAFGQDRAIDFGCIAAFAVSVFLGSYWFSRFAVALGFSAGWGLLFCLAPAVPISAERLTVDAALAACCTGFALYLQERSDYKLYAVLTAAALIRETGLLLTAACVLFLVASRDFRRAILFSTATVPALCWYFFVNLRTAPGTESFFSPVLFAGFIRRIETPFPYPFTGPAVPILRVLDLLALAGIGAAVAWAIYRAFGPSWTPVTVAIWLFAALTVTLSSADAWSEVNAFGRTLTPLVLLSVLDGLAIGRMLPVYAMLALDPRIGFQFGGQILNVLRGVF
jgi:hypothetical protein